jgi:anti-anti-sigma factor
LPSSAAKASLRPYTANPVAQFFSVSFPNFPVVICLSAYRAEKTGSAYFGKPLALACIYNSQISEEIMLMHTDKIGDMVVVECEGSIGNADAAATLRNAVMAQEHLSVVVIDLSEVDSIEGAGLAVLGYLQRWARKNQIRFKLFNPSRIVRNMLQHAGSSFQFEIASLEEAMALLARADSEMRWLRGNELRHSA